MQPLKNRQSKGLKTIWSECSTGAFCNTFDLHLAIIRLENLLFGLFLSGNIRQVLLYTEMTDISIYACDQVMLFLILQCGLFSGQTMLGKLLVLHFLKSYNHSWEKQVLNECPSPFEKCNAPEASIRIIMVCRLKNFNVNNATLKNKI